MPTPRIYLNQLYITFFWRAMNLNEDCYYFRKKIEKTTSLNKGAKEVQYWYICLHKENYMDKNGCPPKDKCKGFKSAWIRTLHVED